MKEFLQVLRRFVPPYKKFLVLSVLFNILSAILNIFSFAALIPLLNILFQTEDSMRQVEYIPWTLDNIKDVANNNMNYFVQNMVIEWGATTTLLLIGLFLAFMTFLKTGAYFLSSATDIIARMSGDVQEIENSIMSSLDMLFKNPILIITYFTTLLIISWQLTLFTIFFVPIFGWFMGIIGRKLKAKSVAAQGLWSDTMSQVEETLGGLRIIKAFCAEEKMNERFDKVNSEFRNNIMKVNIRQQLAHPMSEFLGTVMIVIVLWFGGILVLNNQTITGPTFIYYLVILYSIIQPLKEFSKAGYNIPKGLASMERVDKILMAEIDIKDPENPKPLPTFEHEIEFRHVWFGYKARSNSNGNKIENAPIEWVLKDINLVIPKGKTIALVGQSGSGKSTLVDLIPRYYDVQKGEVLIDGINVKDLGVHDLRKLIGNVNQEAILFNDNFYNNITFGVENATQEDVERAAKIANAHDFIQHSDHGYDTNIGDRGSRLSGGQRQRVSIARAILKNPPILILDEATSALDTESERLVQDALEHLMKTRTTIAIAHRLSTIKNSNEICVLHEGQIVERGTHDELMASDGYYKKLHDMQA